MGELWKGHYSFQQQTDKEPLQHTGGAMRETLSLCIWTEGREMAIDFNDSDGNGKGPSMYTSASHNISAFTGLTSQLWHTTCISAVCECGHEDCDHATSLFGSPSTRVVFVSIDHILFRTDRSSLKISLLESTHYVYMSDSSSLNLSLWFIWSLLS